MTFRKFIVFLKQSVLHVPTSASTLWVVCDPISLGISFDGQARLLFHLTYPVSSQTHLWTDINIASSENPGLMDDLLNSDVVAGIFQGGLFHGYVSFDRLL
jgi:hypothetical protein